jgi:hypothetical protein
MTRRFRRAPLLVLASLLLAASVSFCGSGADSFVPPTKAEAGAAGSEVVSREHEECKTRLENFISELDALLDVNPNSLEPLLSLLQRSFPLKNCDIETAIAISRKSKYFRGSEEGRTNYVFLFSLLKASGDSESPFARVHMGK